MDWNTGHISELDFLGSDIQKVRLDHSPSGQLLAI